SKRWPSSGRRTRPAAPISPVSEQLRHPSEPPRAARPPQGGTMRTTAAPPSAPAARAPRRRRARSAAAGYWPYLIPGLLSFGIVILVPFLLNIWYSLHSWKGGLSPKRWIGLDNYIELLSDDAFWLSFRNSLS